MVNYNLSHLTQQSSQEVIGPVQDDEALFLFALIRCKRMRTVLELGGLNGYSSQNFLNAVGPTGTVYTVDLNHVPKMAENHVVLQQDCRTLRPSQLCDELDLVFFDCHVYDAQMEMLSQLALDNVVSDDTVIALHDTNLHPTNMIPWAVEVSPRGWMHQEVERRMVNTLRNNGYEALMLHTNPDRHDASLPARHGLTILSKNRHLLI